MARSLLRREAEKHAAYKHAVNVAKIVVFAQDVEAVANQMQNPDRNPNRRLTRGKGDFVFKYLKKAMLLMQKSRNINPKIASFKQVVSENKPKESGGKAQPLESKQEANLARTAGKELNLNANQKSPAERLETKVNIGFVGKVTTKLAERKISKQHAKRLKQERKQNKKLSKSKAISTFK